ncbi:MAG: thiol peroxidase [Nocardioides sp.]
MAQTSLGDTAVNTVADLPQVGTIAPDFTLTGADFSTTTRPAGTRTVLNIFPSVDTGVCSASVRRFNELAASLDNTEVICVSHDLPFAIGRFCGAEGIENVTVTSAFTSSFGTDFGVRLVDGKFEGLLARAIVVLDTDGTVLYSHLEPQIGADPDFDSAVAALG